MPARKARPALLFKKSDEPQFLALSYEGLARLLQEISEVNDGSSHAERPSKRVKSSNPGHAITIACQHFSFQFRNETPFTTNLSIFRRDIGHYVAMSLRKKINHPDKDESWTLRLAPRRSTHATFDISHCLDQSHISPEQELAFHLATVQGTNPEKNGHVWASTDMTLRLEGFNVDMQLTINIKWNDTGDVHSHLQALPQQEKLRSRVINTWLSPLDHGNMQAPSTPWVPQDFYESAFVPPPAVYDSQVQDMQVPGLTAKLYPFQRRAVQWLLEREGVRWQPNTEVDGVGQLTPTDPTPLELALSFATASDVHGSSYHVSTLLGVATRDSSSFQPDVRGGILAEEMGLGKTLEIIALILLHRRESENGAMVFDSYLGRELRPTGATLIITPQSLLKQWLSELEKHAPQLNILYYQGLKRQTREDAASLAMYDVVLTTYDVLRSEVHSALDPPERSRRRERQYERPKSPLVELSWWRVCVDEAQMVENTTSNASILARILPRVNAWCVTGTPVKDDVPNDLRGLLSFLRLEPYASDATIWKQMALEGKNLFRELFNLISMRHTKSLVRSEIVIPPQKRFVITMPFSAIEEQHYQSLFRDLANECGLDTDGNPIHETWDPDDPKVQNSMRIALDRLRQTALHPEVGGRNRRALGRKAGPLRTVAEVLGAMLEQSDSALRTDQRALLLLRLDRGQILAGLHRTPEARQLWEEVRTDADALVSQAREELEKEVKEAKANEATKSGKQSSGSGEDDEDDDENSSSKVGEARRRLRSALEILHKAIFFCANAYYSIKSDDNVTVPDSNEFKQLEKMEIDSYDQAQAIRKEILQETYGKAKRLMGNLEAAASRQDFTDIPELQSMDQKGIESRRIADAFEDLCSALDAQATQLDEWREAVIQLMLKPLVDEDDTGEVTGQEYEDSTKLQEEIEVYLEVLRATVADRFMALTGNKNTLVELNVIRMIALAKEDEGPFPQRLLELFEIRQALNPAVTEAEPLTTLKGIISELRALSIKLRSGGATETGGNRAAAELAIVQKHLQLAQKQLGEQTKAVTALELEGEEFKRTLNARLEFYRQLQAVSDMVADYDGEADDENLQRVQQQEEATRAKLATAEAKHRYLMHLEEADARSSSEQRLCVICQSEFSVGVLTVCGHQFCKECISMWFRAHRNCPVCKRQLTQANLHDITLKPKELKVHAEGGDTNEKAKGHSQIPGHKNTSIYSEFNPEKLAQITEIELVGPSYTTKVDTLVRHLLWLRESDPGAKSIVFSQYKEFLDVLALAFARYRIGYTSFDKANGVTSFREDASIEVFLLHARAHSSGLNLVNASHVFLCEPLLNTALELQAIARVDRIGQEQETTVWLYIVDGTVEQSIYNLSVRRRMEHMGQHLKGRSKQSTPELLDANLDAANSMELQHAKLAKLMGKNGVSGEAVDKNDLWSCLFERSPAPSQSAELPNMAVRGFLAAEAAEERRMAEQERVD